MSAILADGQEDTSRVLVIEPDGEQRRALVGWLRSEGHQVWEVGEPQQALQWLDRHAVEAWAPDLIVVDASSPALNGIEACFFLRQRPELLTIPIVLLVSAGDRSNRYLGRAVGCTDFLTRPIDRAEAQLRVKSYASLSRASGRTREGAGRLVRQLRTQTELLSRTLERLEDGSRDLARSQEITILRLAQAAEMRDDSTGQHTRRVSAYCHLLVERLGFEEAFCERVRVSSPLHDVGKIGIPDRILLKPSRLDSAETEVVRRHTSLGHHMLSGTGSALLDMAASIALTHHERYDGTGYPQGLAGDDIPVEGRVAAISDVFDALTSARCYKPAFPLDHAREIMKRGRGFHFDPRLLDAFLGSMKEEAFTEIACNAA